MSSIDPEQLVADAGPRVPLVSNRRVTTADASAAVSGFGGLGSVFVDVDVLRARAHGFTTPTLTVLVEHSSDGMDWSPAATFTFNSSAQQSQEITSPKDYLRVSWSVGEKTAWHLSATVALGPTTSELANISDSYGGSQSHQTVAADLELAAAAGKDTDSAFLAAAMFNLFGSALTKTKNYLGGVIGALSVTGTKATDFQAGAVLGVVMDGVTEADAAVVAIIDGSDPSAETRATAAFAARMNNNNANSGVDYGLDLHDLGRGGIYSDPGPGLPLAISKADLRLSNEVCFISGAGAPVDYTDGEPPATGQDFAGAGSLYIDRTGSDIWMNTGTTAQPLWTKKSA